MAAAVGGGAGGLAAQRVHLLHPRQGETPRNLRQRSGAVSRIDIRYTGFTVVSTLQQLYGINEENIYI